LEQLRVIIRVIIGIMLITTITTFKSVGGLIVTTATSVIKKK